MTSMPNRAKAQPDVIVVGAGIVGAARAHELATHGLDVLVVERAGIGAGVPAAGMGHLVSMDDSAEQFELSAYTRELWLALADRIDPTHRVLRFGHAWGTGGEHN